MKQAWQKFAQRIDALSLRERVIIFAAAALILVMLVNTALLDPQFAKQNQLSQRIKQEQSQLTGIQTEIQTKLKSLENNSERMDQERLQNLRQQAAQMNAALQDMQKGLVSPDKMPELLESILKQNDKLRLVSLKSLPVTSINEPASLPPKTSVEKTSATSVASINNEKIGAKTVADAVYKHGVVITVQGSYLDMVNYMAALEETPWQLFWGKADLVVNDYPKATLTLTLFTLSLDKRWLNL